MTSFRSTLHSFDLLVVFVEESLLEEDEIILCHDLPAQHHRQELVVGDVLVQRGHDVLLDRHREQVVQNLRRKNTGPFLPAARRFQISIAVGHKLRPFFIHQNLSFSVFST